MWFTLIFTSVLEYRVRMIKKKMKRDCNDCKSLRGWGWVWWILWHANKKMIHWDKKIFKALLMSKRCTKSYKIITTNKRNATQCPSSSSHSRHIGEKVRNQLWYHRPYPRDTNQPTTNAITQNNKLQTFINPLVLELTNSWLLQRIHHNM